MKKWLIIGFFVLLAGGIAGWWYYSKDKKEPEPDADAKSDSGTSSSSSSNTTQTQPSADTTAISKASKTVIKELQKALNSIPLSEQMPYGKSSYGSLTEDGIWGKQTKYAVQWVFAVQKTIKGSPTTPESLNVDGETLASVRKAIDFIKQTNLQAANGSGLFTIFNF